MAKSHVNSRILVFAHAYGISVEVIERCDLIYLIVKGTVNCFLSVCCILFFNPYFHSCLIVIEMFMRLYTTSNTGILALGYGLIGQTWFLFKSSP